MSQRPVGSAGAAAAARYAAGPPAGTDQTAAHRRDPVADPDGRAVARRPAGLRAVATRYDKLAVRYEATVCIAAISEWL